MPDRYGLRTSYHVWSVIDRRTGEAVEHFGAFGRGDVAALAAARARRDELNLRLEDAADDLPNGATSCELSGEHLDINAGVCVACGEYVLS